MVTLSISLSPSLMYVYKFTEVVDVTPILSPPVVNSGKIFKSDLISQGGDEFVISLAC